MVNMLCEDCLGCDRCVDCNECIDCVNCVGCVDCHDCHHCIDGIGLYGKSYMIGNRQYTRQEFIRAGWLTS